MDGKKTRVTFMDDGREVMILAKGHTETRVCSAVSFILQVFAEFLEEYEIESDVIFDSGFMRIIYKKLDTGIYEEEMEHHLEFVKTGLEMIEDAYGEYIDLVETG